MPVVIYEPVPLGTYIIDAWHKIDTWSKWDSDHVFEVTYADEPLEIVVTNSNNLYRAES